MRRGQLEQLLQEANSNSPGQDFTISVPASLVPSALTILRHLQAAGQLDSFTRRDANCVGCTNEDECGCISIYGYTG